MKKNPELKLWALWNYKRLFSVQNTRKQCRQYANELVTGGRLEANKMFKAKAFRITRVMVREI